MFGHDNNQDENNGTVTLPTVDDNLTHDSNNDAATIAPDDGDEDKSQGGVHDDSSDRSGFQAGKREPVSPAGGLAKGISDEKERAQALLDIVNEINYFTQHPSATPAVE